MTKNTPSPYSISLLMKQFIITCFSFTLLSSCSSDTSKETPLEESKTKKDSYSVLPIVDESVYPHFKLKEGEKPPESEKEYIDVAERAISIGAYGDAKTYTSKGISLYPSSAKLHYLLGASVMSTVGSNEDDAIQHMEKAAKLGCKDTKMYELLSTLYGQKKDYKKGIEVLNTAIKAKPRKRTLYKYRAVMHLELGEMDKAEEDYTGIIRVSDETKKASSYISRAQFYEGQGQYKKALSDYKKAYETGREKLNVLKKRVPILLKLNKEDAVLKDINEILDIHAKDDDALVMRGDIYKERSEYQKALLDYSKAIEISPDYARNAYLGRAAVYDKLNKPKLAEADRQKAKSIYDKKAEKTLYKMKDKKFKY